ncbi:MAG: 30S ribosomal protein S27ae [Candidatus Bathyarchaeota archaeon]|nr:30S ribosomal protein S27ae [Candidatus Bathyarchaeota archaeon]
MSEKRSERKIFMHYGIKDGKLVRKLKKCPRCGVFMAFHKNPVPRWMCGKCSYTEFVTGSVSSAAPEG